MTLVVLLGGARSGKSSRAVALAAQRGAPVTFVATGEPGDEEMAARIAAHRASRPADWSTIEEPLELERVLSGAEPAATVVVDCLSLWAANAIGRGDTNEEIEAETELAAAAAARRSGLTVAVSNEVGLGIVPATPLGRRYRDVLGRVNATWVAAADEAALVVAGRALPLER